MRQIEVNTGKEMLHGILVCHTLVSVEYNGGLKLAGTVKIRGFDTFSRRISRGGGYPVSYGRRLKLSGRRRSFGVYMHYVKAVVPTGTTSREIRGYISVMATLKFTYSFIKRTVFFF